MARILIIDDEKDCLVFLLAVLTHAGHQVFPLMRADKLLPELESANPDLIITDVMMPGITGAGVYKAIRTTLGKYIPVIVSSGTTMHLRISRDRLLTYIPKPVDERRLLASIESLLADASLLKQRDAESKRTGVQQNDEAQTEDPLIG